MKLLRTAGAVLFAGLTTAACTAPDAPAGPTAAAQPSASTAATATPTPTPTPTASPRPLSADRVGSDGLTVRYQGRDGRIETLRVEDFRR